MEYMVKLRINDDDENLGEEAVRDCVEQMIDAVDSSPFGISIDSFVIAIPKSVDNILLNGICPHCKKDTLYEDERGEEHITFGCSNCKDDRYIHIDRDDMGIRFVVMTWIDESKEEFDDEMEKVIYDRNER